MAHRKSFRPTLETLEGRTLPAGLTAAMLADGTLSITGTASNDAIRVRESAGLIRIDGVASTFVAARVTGLRIAGLAGNDTIDVRDMTRPRPTAIDGGAGADAVYGGAGDDVITGGAGNDQLYGGFGNDTIDGGLDADAIYAGPGDDRLSGGAGNDRLFGGLGSDRLDGGAGTDWLEAGSAGEEALSGWNAHVWALDGTTPTDVQQGYIGTCSFLSALMAATKQGIDLSGRIAYVGDYTYRVRLFDPASGAWKSVDVKFDGTAARERHGWSMDPLTAPEGEYWAALMQRAYLRLSGYDPMSAATGERFPGDYLERTLSVVTGRRVSSAWPAAADPAALRSALGCGSAMTAGSYCGATDPVVVGCHAYAVDDVYQEGDEWFVRLRNPWGIDGYVPQGEDDGLITLSWAAFGANYSDVAWAAR